MEFSAPQQCPQCGSWHTMPKDDYSVWKFIYEDIWKEQDEKNRHTVDCFFPNNVLEKSTKEIEEWNNQGQKPEQ